MPPGGGYVGVGDGVGDGVGCGGAEGLGFPVLEVFEGDGEGDHVADAVGGGEGVAVTVTGGGAATVGTEFEVCSAGVSSGDHSRSSSGTTATPSAVEASTRRRDTGHVPSAVPVPADGPAGAGAGAGAVYAVPAHGSSPSARVARGSSRRAHSSSYAAVQCPQWAMWVCRSALSRGPSGRTDSSMSRRKSAHRGSSEAASRARRQAWPSDCSAGRMS
ncbi:hypothetical protein SHIRM173S_12896 [Streptomyces hirsutus]